MFRSFSLFLLVLIGMASAFSTVAPTRGIKRASFVKPACPASSFSVLHMSEEPKADAESGAEAAAAPSEDGTFYDDEVDPTPNKPALSDNMRARLMAEASTGLDADTKQTNVLLYIMVAIAGLVVVGGAGIFY